MAALFLSVGFFFVSAVEDIINGNIMKIGEFDKDLRRDIKLPSFVIAVNTLTAIEYFCYLRLRHICVLTQISYSDVHSRSFFGKCN